MFVFLIKALPSRFRLRVNLSALLLGILPFFFTGCSTVKTTPSSPEDQLIFYAEKGDLSNVQTWVAKGADINGGKKHEGTPIARPLVGMGDIINWFGEQQFGQNRQIPLIQAARAGSLEVVKWLVEHGADINLQESAYIIANFQQIHQEAVFMVLKVTYGNNAISAAILAGQSNIVKFLVEHGADISRSVVFQSATIPSVVAIIMCNPKGIGLSIRASVNDVYGYTDCSGKSLYQSADGLIHTVLPVQQSQELSIHELMAKSKIHEIRVLRMKATENANIADDLMRASKEGHIEIVQALLDKGVSVNTKQNNGYTALMAASGEGHKEIVQLLLAKGADINEMAPALVGGMDITALMMASMHGHREVVQALLAKGADVNAKMANDYTALMAASEQGHIEIVQLLLSKGAEVNAKDRDGKTALMYASQKGHKEVEELLIKAGAK